jgi:DEAD/DEAH box helicase domain-containing protein
MDHVVVDVEIQKTIEETPGGWDATDKLGVACAVVYEFQKDRYVVYGHTDDDLYRLKDRLLAADRVSGYNIWKFDFPVIWQIPARLRVEEMRGKTDDLLARIWEALGLNPERFSEAHKGWSLDDVASGTLLERKTGYGGDAPKWFQAGNWAKLVSYCIQNVKLERDLTQFVDKYGFVRHSDGRCVDLDTWEPAR